MEKKKFDWKQLLKDVLKVAVGALAVWLSGGSN